MNALINTIRGSIRFATIYFILKLMKLSHIVYVKFESKQPENN